MKDKDFLQENEDAARLLFDLLFGDKKTLSPKEKMKRLEQKIPLKICIPKTKK